eukprot:258196_1
MAAFNLSIYDDVPQMEVTLDRFEELVVSRLTLLRWIESQKLHRKGTKQKQQNKNKNQTQTCLDDLLKEHHLLNHPLYDNLSHFICRLAFSQIKEYSSWFIRHEVTLFESKYVLSSCKSQQHIALKLLNHNQYPLYNANDIILNDLNGRTPIPFFQFDSTSVKSHYLQNKYLPFHILPFNECCPKLIAQRLVYIRNGFVFVPHFLFSGILCDRYQQYLRKQMRNMQQVWLNMKQDEAVMYELSKVIHIIKNIHKIRIPLDHPVRNAHDTVINHCNINEYVRLFPLCMRYSYESLLEHGHLKNNARIQLTLFLKGIGLSLQEALLFFKRHFIQKQSQFNSHYAYYIRHQYGKAGAAVDYTPFACAKIIMKSEDKRSNDDHYGCPFKMFDKARLELFINRYYDVEYNAEDGDKKLPFQLQCKQFCNVLNKDTLKQKYEMDIEDLHSSWNHPNTYYNISHRIQYAKNAIPFKQKYHREFVNKTIEYC